VLVRHRAQAEALHRRNLRLGLLVVRDGVRLVAAQRLEHGGHKLLVLAEEQVEHLTARALDADGALKVQVKLHLLEQLHLRLVQRLELVDGAERGKVNLGVDRGGARLEQPGVELLGAGARLHKLGEARVEQHGAIALGVGLTHECANAGRLPVARLLETDEHTAIVLAERERGGIVVRLAGERNRQVNDNAPNTCKLDREHDRRVPFAAERLLQLGRGVLRRTERTRIVCRVGLDRETRRVSRAGVVRHLNGERSCARGRGGGGGQCRGAEQCVHEKVGTSVGGTNNNEFGHGDRDVQLYKKKKKVKKKKKKGI
jgi:hypothetical protein